MDPASEKIIAKIKEEGGRYEIINGKLIVKRGETPANGFSRHLLAAWLSELFGGMCVAHHGDIDLSQPRVNEPEASILVVNQPYTSLGVRHPGPSDVVLVVEVSDKTLDFDRTTKAVLYARAGITEYWILDIAGRQVLVHRLPQAGGYADVTSHGPDERIATLARPEQGVLVADLFPSSVTV